LDRKKGLAEMQETQVKEIGDSLRQRRKELNLSLKEAENATSIRIVYLQALEDGEMDKLISPVYAQGFFRQYAALLGMDGDHIVRENPEIFNRHASQEFTYGIGTLEYRGNPGASVKWIPNALWIGAFSLVLICAWYFAKFFGVL
jgi:transcriptional regulator with XRE-family HTH domain